ncbi:MAG: enoyl-CoA hydratase-related protein [Acidimicrobiales bacterium]
MLSRLIGHSRAAELLFSSRVIMTEEAAEMGLVNKVMPAVRGPSPVVVACVHAYRRPCQDRRSVGRGRAHRG